ncbi:MAG: recombinase family protein [Candidatus Kaistia colombiensis]|nr:MAG: recombinase family protein [Kaistia sp.]
MVKAYSYLRFSTVEQQHGDSYRRQTTMATDYAVSHRLELDERSYQDLGVSAFRGQNAETGRLSEFLEAVRVGAIEQGAYLLVESLDRISRSKPRRAVQLLQTICDAGITVVTLADGRVYDSETLDDDPFAFMMAFMLAIRANEESATKSRRLKAAWGNKRVNASQKPVTSICPQWLRRAGDSFELVPERAEVVRRIFDMAAGGGGQHAIAEALNKDAVPVFGRGRMWHRSYIAKILANVASIGVYIPHELEIDALGKKRRRPLAAVEGYYPAVISPAVFASVNDARRGTFSARGPSSSRAPAHTLAGLARCPECESAMTRINKGAKGGNPYLICTKAKAAAGCRRQHVPLALVEETMASNVERLVEECPTGASTESLEQSLVVLDISRDQLLDRARDLLERSLEDPKSLTLRAAVQDADARLGELDAEIEHVRAKLRELSGPLLISRLTTLREAFRAGDMTQMNLALRRLMLSVTVDYRQGALRFQWRHGGQSEFTYDGGALLSWLDSASAHA